MGTFYDHFSGHAELYRKHRPRYPPELYEWLASQVDCRRVAWDCATGNGQAALGLAARFERVVATDASPRQLAQSMPDARVRYVLAAAEAAPLRQAAVDLVTIAQALHWFDLGAFFAEVRRVVRPGGFIAAWTYQLFSIDAGVDAALEPFYHGVLEPYWPPQRAHVKGRYADLPFPFDEVAAPAFVMRPVWTRDDVLRQVSTWSAVRRHDAATGGDAVALLADALRAAWPDGAAARPVTWELTLRAGRL